METFFKKILILCCMITTGYYMHSQSSGFVYAEGDKFMLDGKPFYFSGANVYDFFTYGSSSGDIETQFMDKDRIDTHMRRLYVNGVRVVRLWGFSHEDWHGFEPQKGVYSEGQFSLFDYVVKSAEANGIKLIVALENYWNDYGGIKDRLKWEGIDVAGGGSHDQGQFFTNEDAIQGYKDYVKYFITRVNHYDGVEYRNDPTILAWELMNEPRYQGFGDDLSSDTLRAWVDDMGEFIKGIDTNHLLGTGLEAHGLKYGFGGDEGNDFIKIHESPYVDFTSAHPYIRESWADFTLEETMALICQWADESHKILEKPLYIGEFNVEIQERFEWWEEIYGFIEEKKIGASAFWWFPDNETPRDKFAVLEGDTEVAIYKEHALKMEEMSGGESIYLSLLSPKSGDKFVSGSDVHIEANLLNENNTVAKVEFFSNGVLVGEDISAPYELDLSGLPDGAYAITSVATGINGITKESTSRNIQIGGDGVLTLEYKDASTSVISNVIKPHLRIFNNSSEGVSYADLSIRYWFETEEDLPLNFSVDYAVVGNTNVKGRFVNIEGNSYYLELTFDPATGILGRDAGSGRIEAKIANSQFSDTDQSNDYSYNGILKEFGRSDKVALYLNGKLISGVEPNGNPNPPVVDGGVITGGPFAFTVGDGIEDNVSGISVSGSSGSNATWVVTDDQLEILGLPPTIAALEGVNFDVAGTGTCLIWYLRYEDGLQGAAVGNNAANLAGNFDLSNSITVTRNPVVVNPPVVDGGVITGGPFTFTVGDGIEDNVSGISVSGSSGSNATWVVTDDQLEILGLPPTIAALEGVNFDVAGTGTCLIWYLRYEDGLQGAAVGNNAADLVGNFDLSNSITVTRNPVVVDGGTITGGPFTFTVGDGIEDNVSGISVSGSSGSNATWVVTDDQLEILGLPPTIAALEGVNFDVAGTGTCLIWYLRYEDGLQGAAVGNNAADLVGNFDLSNSITVTRNPVVVNPPVVDGGVITGGPFTFTVGDGIEDNVSGISVSGSSGSNATWVVTDDQLEILGLPPTIAALEGVNFDVAGTGTCLIWYLRYEDGLQGAAVGNNAADLVGNFDLSNSITVTRNPVVVNPPVVDGGVITGGPFTFTVGDGIEDNVSGISVSGSSGSNATWVVTDDQLEILGLPPTIAALEGVNFDVAGTGTCLIWYLRYEDGLQGAAVGNNAADLVGNFDLSNSITVTRNPVPPTGGDCNFGAPLNNALPTIANFYSNSYVIGKGGPDLSNVINFTINWDLANNGLWQFSMNTNNGIPSWWNDLNTKITTQNLDSAQPSITLSGTGFPNLDGGYYAVVDGDNFALVAKSGDFTIYFSNSNDAPNCGDALKSPISDNTGVKIFPNPVEDRLFIQSNTFIDGAVISLVDITGRIIKKIAVKPSAKEVELNTFDLNSGVYFIKINNNKENEITQRFIKK